MGVIQLSLWLTKMELTWSESKLLLAFTRMSFRNASEFQRCLSWCGYAVPGQAVVGMGICPFPSLHSSLHPPSLSFPFFLLFPVTRFWFLSLLTYFDVCCRTGQLSLAGLSVSGNIGTGVASGALPPLLECGLASYLVTFPHRKWQLVWPDSSRYGHSLPRVS